MANLFATLMSYWEVCRDKRVTQSLEQLEATGMIIHMMAEVRKHCVTIAGALVIKLVYLMKAFGNGNTHDYSTSSL